MDSPNRQQIELLALCALRGVDWHVIAREAQRPGGIERLLRGEVGESSKAARETARLLTTNLSTHAERMTWAADQLELAHGVQARLVTVLDEHYPLNLRLIFNLPPFLFYRGTLQEDDSRSVAVVGTREPTEEGRTLARDFARTLTSLGVTVVSGLAKGIDTEAHTETLRAGGRTLAVIGTGITRCYPDQNRELAERIVESGALLSQFWPTSAPTRASFPMRNVTMSGITQGSVIVEASATSGAKMQARLALEHGKRVFLVTSLIAQQSWAREYLKRPGAMAVDSATEVVGNLRTAAAIHEVTSQRHQLVLELA